MTEQHQAILAAVLNETEHSGKRARRSQLFAWASREAERISAMGDFGATSALLAPGAALEVLQDVVDLQREVARLRNVEDTLQRVFAMEAWLGVEDLSIEEAEMFRRVMEGGPLPGEHGSEWDGGTLEGYGITRAKAAK